MSAWDFVMAVMLSAPLWTPVVIGAYALGRKQFGIMLLFALIAAEALSVGAFQFARFIIAMNSFHGGGFHSLP